jgi:rhodanese-related sulfurtransferase
LDLTLVLTPVRRYDRKYVYNLKEGSPMKSLFKIFIIVMVVFIPFHQAFACASCSGGGPQYKGHSLADAPGYFAREFDKVAPAPGMDWEDEVLSIWFPGAFERGWVVKTSPKDAIPGALILGFDKSYNVWVGIVREVDAGKIVFETLDDKGEAVQNYADVSTMKQKVSLIGYIWPMRVKDNAQKISMDKAMEAWKNKEALFIDVRASDKYKQGHIPGAISIPLTELKTRLKETPKNKTVLLICRSGQGSSQANLILQSYGFANTFSVSGGMLEWRGSIEK